MNENHYPIVFIKSAIINADEWPAFVGIRIWNDEQEKEIEVMLPFLFPDVGEAFDAGNALEKLFSQWKENGWKK